MREADIKPLARIPGRYRDAEQIAAIQHAIGKRRHSTRFANLGPFTGYRIGLDIGNGNIGWCILFEQDRLLQFLTAEDIAANNAKLPKGVTRTQLPNLADFVPLGTHKFQARKPGEKIEKSFSKIRAEVRAKERMLDARQRRRLHVRKAISEAGLLPENGICDGIGHEKCHSRISADKLRVKLLNPSFDASAHDLGRALYNLLKRRGWLKPIGRAGEDEGSTFGDKATQYYREALKAFGCETIGAFLDRCAQDAKRDGVHGFRKRHRSLAWQRENQKKQPKDLTKAKSYEVLQFLTPTFELVWEEALLLRARQQRTVPIRDDHWAKIEEAAEFRRSLKAKMPGRCRWFPDEFRCVRALPSYQRFRILEQVSHLRDPHNRVLNDASFGSAVALLEQSEKISVTHLAKELGQDRLRLESDEDKGKRTLVGAKTDIALKSVLGQSWMQLSLDERDAWTMRFLRRHVPMNGQEPRPWTSADEEDLRSDTEKLFGPDALTKVDNIASTSFEDNFASISLKAAKILADAYAKRLDHEQRLAALASAGAPEPELPLYERLPYYGAVMPDQTVPAIGFAPPERMCAEEREHGRAPNPDVHVVMNRVRAVINAIIDMMGGILPTTCVVEVARSALSEDEANAHRKRVMAREKFNQAIIQDIARVFEGLGKRLPRGPGLERLIECWKAAIRQGWRDYDGSRIERSMLIDPTVYQLDHVIPAAFGDFRENNLFVSKYNKIKGRKTPWEAFGNKQDFRPALTAFAEFGLSKRIELLEKALDPKRKLPTKKKAYLEERLKNAREELAELSKSETPRPDVLSALERTLTDKLESLLTCDDSAGDNNAEKGPRRPFDSGDQAALFCRFGPRAKAPEKEFAARDTANIGWSTKLTLRYLRHLGAEVEAIKPWAVHALRSMFGINKERGDLRNHAVDAFFIAHFDSRVLRPAFASLRGGPEWLYSTRLLDSALSHIDGGQGFLNGLERNLDCLDKTLPVIATAHRADNMWNPGDPVGGSFGALGGENIYSFRPTREEREKLTAILAGDGKSPVGHILTRTEILELLKSEPQDKKNRRLLKKLRDAVELRYLSREEKGTKRTLLKISTAMPLSDQPGAFIDVQSKFAIMGPTPNEGRLVVNVADFSAMSLAKRTALFRNARVVYRRGDMITSLGSPFVVTGLTADGRLIAYTADVAQRDKQQKHLLTVPSGIEGKDSNPKTSKPILNKLSIDVLGRRLHRLRKTPGGLAPMPYPLREQ